MNRKGKLLKKPIDDDDDDVHLPSDIIFQNILPKLPLRSLLNFKTVSKSWNSTLSHPSFIKQTDPNLLYFVWRPSLMSNQFLFLTYQNHKFETPTIVEFPGHRYRFAVLLCTCDGLILLKDSDNKDPNEDSKKDYNLYVIWNPFTRTYTEFSSPHPFRVMKYAHGLCYDPFSDDYKVVFISRDFYSSFSLKNKSWTDKKTLTLASINWSCGLIFNGILHWIVEEACGDDEHHRDRMMMKKKSRGLLLGTKRCGECTKTAHYIDCPIYESIYMNREEVIYFNARYDRLEKLPKPECFDDTVQFGMTNLKGHLCLYRNTYDKTRIEIWMMKEYGDATSWIKFLAIENVPMLHRCGGNYVRYGRHVKPIGMTKDDSEIIICVTPSNYIVYNTKKNTFGELKAFFYDWLPRSPSYTITVNPIPFLDSLLVLPLPINGL